MIPSHSLKYNFEIITIEQLPILGSNTETDLFRLEREDFWIRTLERRSENILFTVIWGHAYVKLPLR